MKILRLILLIQGALDQQTTMQGQKIVKNGMENEKSNQVQLASINTYVDSLVKHYNSKEHHRKVIALGYPFYVRKCTTFMLSVTRQILK